MHRANQEFSQSQQEIDTHTPGGGVLLHTDYSLQLELSLTTELCPLITRGRLIMSLLSISHLKLATTKGQLN